MTTDIRQTGGTGETHPFAPNFIAIDFETATARRDSICEAGICVVRQGRVAETRSWLVQPEGNRYNYRNITIHGIRPEKTADAPRFPEVWAEICEYLRDCPVLVAHNAAFDISCIRESLHLYGLPKPDIAYFCSLTAARKIYDFRCNKLDYLCNQFDIEFEHHHRAGDDAEMCARLFLRELRDAGWADLEEMGWCGGKV